MAQNYPVAMLQECGARIVDELTETGEPVFLQQAGYVRAVIVPAESYLADMQALREFQRIYGTDGVPRTKSQSNESTV